MPDSRIAFADANWLFATYHQTRDTPRVREWAEQGESRLVVSGPVLAECACHFWRVGNQWPRLESDVRAGLFADCGWTFEQLVQWALPWFRRFAPRARVGTLDLLHVTAARRFGCQWFLSFDTASGCRAVATAVGLRVFPPLTEQDRTILNRVR